MIDVNIPYAVKKIGVVSDTHIPARARYLPPALFRVFKDVDLILHAGDLVVPGVLDDFSSLAPVEAVAGNMDSPELYDRLGRVKIIQLNSLVIGLIHGDGTKGTTPGRALAAFPSRRAGIVVFGHSHYPLNEIHNGITLFNPGSPVDPRRAPGPSCGILTISGSAVRGEIHYL